VSPVAPKNERGGMGRGLDPVLTSIRAVLGVNGAPPRSEVTPAPAEAERGNRGWVDLVSPPNISLSVWDSPAARTLERALDVAAEPVH
jgi:hypothetical protein